VNQAQPADSAWQVLADTFETFLLGEGLPEGLQQQQLQQRGAGESLQGPKQQQRELQHSSSESGSASFRQGAAQGGNSSGTAAGGPSTEEAALQKAVLDCLTEQVIGRLLCLLLFCASFYEGCFHAPGPEGMLRVRCALGRTYCM
jgi:hypothetical protein